MKPFNHPAWGFLLAVLGTTLAGCSSTALVAPLSSGYEEVTHSRRSMKDSADTRISLQYRAPDGRTLHLWPSLYGVNEVIQGDVAMFVGDLTCEHPDSDTPRTIEPRLFAVKAPGLPLDITDEILWRWSQAEGKDFTQARQRFSLVTPEEKAGRLELHLEFWANEKDWPDKSMLQLDWGQVSDIMREVKTKGTVRKDMRWGTTYIGKGP
jgi:hypothetical protein